MANETDGATWTWWAAWWGAIIATFNLAWAIWLYRRDRGRLKVNLVIGRRIPHPQGVDRPDFQLLPAEQPVQEQDQLCFHITNIGRRAITPTKIIGFDGPWFGMRTPWLWWRRRALLIPPCNLPRTLEPTEFVIEWMDDPGWPSTSGSSTGGTLPARDGVSRGEPYHPGRGDSSAPTEPVPPAPTPPTARAASSESS